MKRIERDIESILSLKEKEKILKQLNQLDLLNLFKDEYKVAYSPIKPKKASLDQQISIAISREEKELIQRELIEIRKVGPTQSISSFIRNRVTTSVDIADWYEKAVEGLQQLGSVKFNPKELKKQQNVYMKLLEDLDDDDTETEFYYNKKLSEIKERLTLFAKIKPRRGYRLSGRVTYNESNVIRWRASRLTLSIADYTRFVMFGYNPFSDADKHMTIDARKRLYISVIDVYTNGWGDPPRVEDCPNCARYMNDVKILKAQLERCQDLKR